MQDFLKACQQEELLRPSARAYGMIVSAIRWDEVVSNVQFVKPSREGLTEFCGFKVQVNDLVPDYLIVWTDSKGVPLHITDLRKDDET